MSKLYLKGLTALGKCVVAGAKARQLPNSIPEYPEEEPVPVVNALPAPMQSPKTAAPVAMPTTAETIQELKQRLAKELYRMELDLLGGGRIAGKPCDCLDMKHHFGIEATAEELIAMDHNPAYQGAIAWLKAHQEEFKPSEIEKRPPEYYQGLVPELRRFRKAILGTETPKEQVDCQPCAAKANAIKDLALKVKAGELTMDEAKAKVKELA